jgi:hypothetical protein
MDTEAARQRARQAELDAEVSRASGSAGPPAFFAGRVVDGGAKPTSVPGQYLIRPFTPVGPAVEGAGAAFTDVGDQSVVVTVLGPRVPAVGDGVIASRGSAAWFARSGVTGGGRFCGCPDVPDTLALTLRGVCGFWRAPCTLAFKEAADVASMGLGFTWTDGDGYWGPRTARLSGAADYHLVLICDNPGTFILGQATYSSVYSPGLFGRLATYVMGAPHTCSPFYLHGSSATNVDIACPFNAPDIRG